MSLLLFTCVAAGVASYFLVGWVRKEALERALMDVPNERSLHSVATPRGGGLGIVIAFLIAAAVYIVAAKFPLSTFVGPLAVGAASVAWIGWLDDHGHVSPFWRALVHVLAGAIALYWLLSGFHTVLPNGRLLGPPEEKVNLFIAGGAFAAAYFLNLYNFMDGLDGLAGSEGAFLGIATPLVLFSAISVEVPGGQGLSFFPWSQHVINLAPILGCCCLGFLVWNWPPARIFMGDVCSGFLGFVFAFFALASSWELPRLAWVWLILFGVFLVDGTYTLLVRFATKQKWYEAHRLHAFQKAALMAGRHKPVTLAVLGINIFWLLPLAWLAAKRSDIAPWLTLIALAPLVVVAHFYRAGVPEAPSQTASTVAK